jgi:hypothetical protein
VRGLGAGHRVHERGCAARRIAGGRDIDAVLPAAKSSSKKDEKWPFECKRYQGTVPFSEIIVKLYQIQYLKPLAPSALVVLSSGALSNDTHDFLENYAADLSFPVILVTNDEPERRFDAFLLERLARVNAFLTAKGKPTYAAPASVALPASGATLARLLLDQGQTLSPRARIESALKLNAYPFITASWTSVGYNWSDVSLHIANIGNGFAQRLELRVIHKGVLAGEYQLSPIQAGGWLNGYDVHATIAPANLPPPNEPDNLDLLFTYENALGHQFESVVRIEAYMQGGQRLFKSLRKNKRS